MNARATTPTGPTYPLGSVVRLTGLGEHTIRAWERRYAAVIPERTPGGTRRYSAADVARLRLLVSLNADEHIDPAQVLGRWTYDHPVFDRDAMEAQKLHSRIDGLNRTHYCGAWWGYGFHEDGVRSALSVAERLGTPWR
jgi:hypothetical protein